MRKAKLLLSQVAMLAILALVFSAPAFAAPPAGTGNEPASNPGKGGQSSNASPTGQENASNAAKVSGSTGSGGGSTEDSGCSGTVWNGVCYE